MDAKHHADEISRLPGASVLARGNVCRRPQRGADFFGGRAMKTDNLTLAVQELSDAANFLRAAVKEAGR